MTTYDLLADPVRDDPTALFTELRRDAPVATLAPFGWLAVSRYADVATVLDRVEVFAPPPPGLWLEREGAPRLAEVTLAAPEPGPARAWVAALLDASRLEAFERGQRRLAHVGADRLLERDSLDLVGEMALTYSASCGAELCAVPPARRADFVRQASELISGNDIDGEDRTARADLDVADFRSSVLQLIMARRENPGADLLSALTAANPAAVMSDDELVAIALHLLLDGNEISANLLCNTVLALAENVEVQRELREDPSRVAVAIEETLRLYAPVIGVLRVATQDTEIAGVAIPSGATVLALVASAGRDPDQFPDPDRFDLNRENLSHLTLGTAANPRICGARVRQECRLAVETLLERLPEFSRSPGVVGWTRSVLHRGPRVLPVAFSESR